MLAVLLELGERVVEELLVNGCLVAKRLIGRIWMPRRSAHLSVSSLQAKSPLANRGGPLLLLIGDASTLYAVTAESTGALIRG
jgi:hypothetical protein